MNTDTILSDSPISLRNLVRDRENGAVQELEKHRGVEGVASILKVEPNKGVESSDVSIRRQKYGSNTQEPDEMTTYFAFLKDAFSDFTIIMLAFAGLVSLGIPIGYSRDAESYAKGAAILISVLIVTNVTAVNEYNKQAQFARLGYQ
jgi:magnesium-transporting ATPase (P-type)